ncbi:MAG: hypothetical protein ABN488_21655, partial [Methylobacteriaceae bacterium]
PGPITLPAQRNSCFNKIYSCVASFGQRSDVGLGGTPYVPWPDRGKSLIYRFNSKGEFRMRAIDLAFMTVCGRTPHTLRHDLCWRTEHNPPSILSAQP